MTKKLEEVFDLPNYEDLGFDEEEKVEQPEQDENFTIEDIQKAIDEADKIDNALSPVRNLEALDNEMDDYANMSIDAFKDLMDLGQNVEDRHAAPIFDSASKMMANALTAKTAKIDKKLKMVQMQIQKEMRRLDHQIEKDKRGGEFTDAIAGEGEIVVDRNEIINAVLNKVKNGENKK
jgi:hypothetical protein